MYCAKCGKKLEENQKFCSGCGQPVKEVKQAENNRQNKSQMKKEQFENEGNYHRKYSENTIQKQPTKALVIEGFGILLLVITRMLDQSRDYTDQLWAAKNGWVLYIIGFILFVIAYVMLKKHKKKYGLQGIGYAGYIISCMGVVIVVIFSVLMIFTMAFSNMIMGR